MDGDGKKQQLTACSGSLSHKATLPSVPGWNLVMDGRRALELLICHTPPSNNFFDL